MFSYSKLNVGADLLSLFRSTIGAGELNFRVRNENGWTLLLTGAVQVITILLK